MTQATASYHSNSPPPSKDALTSKSATLGPATVRPPVRPFLSPTASTTHEIRGQSLVSISHHRGNSAKKAGMSLPPSRKRPSPYEEADDEDDTDGTSRDLQAVTTDFYDRCCKYFANPLTKVVYSLVIITLLGTYLCILQQPEDADTASPGYQAREYRFIRNHLARDEAKKMCPLQAKSKLSDQVFVNKVDRTPHLLKFHPYAPHLAVMHKSEWRLVNDIHR